MRPIRNKEDIENLKTDEKLLRCITTNEKEIENGHR